MSYLNLILSAVGISIVALPLHSALRHLMRIADSLKSLSADIRALTNQATEHRKERESAK